MEYQPLQSAPHGNAACKHKHFSLEVIPVRETSDPLNEQLYREIGNWIRFKCHECGETRCLENRDISAVREFLEETPRPYGDAVDRLLVLAPSLPFAVTE